MGYRDVSGLVLQRRDLFENDQEIILLTEDGGIEARAPHARKSQKTFCGRLEPPNAVSGRLYRSRENSRWILSSVNIETVYADLLRDDRLRYRLWPLLALYRDVFPEGEPPETCLPHLRKGLRYLKEGFRPALLVTNRVLTRVAQRTGVAFEPDHCSSCRRPMNEILEGSRPLGILPRSGMVCPDCRKSNAGKGQPDEDEWTVNVEQLELYEDLKDLTWEEVCAREYSIETMKKLEALLYRLFRYHFEISLETLEIRKSL